MNHENQDQVEEANQSTTAARPVPRPTVYRRCGKRLCDIVLATCGLVVAAIPMLIIAALVKLTSPGPVFFRQERFGQDSRPFVIIKYRTMVQNAPVKANKDFTKEAMASFVTPLGRFLRKSSLDELPQFFNVLSGKMSLVGPRPLAATDREVLDLRQASGADRVRPGITGLAQINGRNEISNPEKAAYDAEYAATYSMRRDLSIFAQSVIVIVAQRGINSSASH
ncbi:sugar transferase [Lacticaseibacillus kribbianus]|uniref:sugar transferase n=1 Tax=Lacticaseibacillus kribbianus TaxID=2926292 RepID=UPI001CD6BE58|nr:sugar transferase [Lacticaseibacillus kribbianus]